MTSARSLIRTDLTALAEALRRRGVLVDVAMMRELRDFGLACFALGYQYAHDAPTIPVPAADDEPEITIDHDTGQYTTTRFRGQGT